MDKKKLRRLVVIFPVVGVLVVVGAVLAFVLMSASGPGPEGVSGTGTAQEGAMATDEDMPACDFADWVGKPVVEDAIRATGRPVRILAPGSAITMDFDPQRININTDDDGVVISVTCG